MDLSQIREREIFETLKAIKHLDFVLIGGYAVTAYTQPRFSVDCDIVVNDSSEVKKIVKILIDLGYYKSEETLGIPYSGEFERYIKDISLNFKVSMDILIGKLRDRQTGSEFSSQWIFEHSKERNLKGKMIVDDIKIRIVEPDALFALKLMSCRSTDIRDMFLLISIVNDMSWIKGEVSSRADFKERIKKAINEISKKQFKDGLQGVFGFVDNSLFEKHARLIKELAELE